MSDIAPAPSPFAELVRQLPKVPATAALALTATEATCVATLVARPLHRGTVGAHIERLHGVSLPDGPERRVAAGFAAIGTGPDSWLCFNRSARPDWAWSLAEELGDSAFVADQSGAWALLEVHGAEAGTLLARAASVDVESFEPGSAAMTVIAHIGVLIWRAQDGEEGYVLAVPRSLVASFWHWLDCAAAGLGFALAARRSA